MSLLLKLPSKKVEPYFYFYFILFFWSRFLLMSLFITIKLLYTYIKWSCIEYYYCVWADCFSCYLDIWDSYRRGYVGLLDHHLLLLLIETLTHCRNVVRLSLFYRCCFGICPSKMAELVPLLYSRGSSCRYSNRMYDFSVIPRCYKDISVNRIFSHTVKLWNYLLAKHFPLAHDLSGLMSAFNRHLFGLYLKQFS